MSPVKDIFAHAKMLALNVFFDCGQRVETVEEEVEYGKHIDLASAMARDEDGRPVGFSVEPRTCVGSECTVEAGETSYAGTLLALDPAQATLQQEGRVFVVSGYDCVQYDGDAGGVVRADARCTFSHLTRDLRWECVCQAMIKEETCSLAFSALVHNDSGRELEADTCCIAARHNGDVSTEDSVGYSLGVRRLPPVSSHLLFAASMPVTRYYSYTIGRRSVTTGYMGKAPEYLPAAATHVYRDGRALGLISAAAARTGDVVRLSLGRSEQVEVEETSSAPGTVAQLKMTNRADREALIEVYLEGRWSDVTPQGYHDEGTRLRWMVLLPPRATKTLACRATAC